MSEQNDGLAIAVWVVVASALVLVLALVVAPILAHLAWDVFVRWWNVV